MTEKAPTAAERRRDASDNAELHYLRLLGRAVVLSRLAELLEATSGPNATSVDFAGNREDDFWRGIRELSNDIADSADELHAAVLTLDREGSR